MRTSFKNDPRRGLLALATLAALGLTAARPAFAQELVTNGGFETGDFSSWIHTSNDLLVGNNSSYAHTGQHAAWFGAAKGNVDSLSQPIATQAGKSYDVSFWAYSGDNTTSGFTASFADQPLFSGLLPLSTFTQFTYIVTASSDGSLLEFTGYNHISYDFLDDISVTPAVAATPEPSQYTGLGVGVLGLAVLAVKARRRKSQAA